MKQLVDVAGEGLVLFLGKRITLFCLNYIYTGNLVGVNDKFVKLDDAAIVYETGPLCAAGWQDAQKLPNAAYVMLASVESFMELK